MSNIKELPYAQWLETALQDLIKFPVKGICINAIGTDGLIYTNYHDMSMSDKITVAGFIQQDAMLDTLRANGFIKDDEEEEDE